MSKAKRFLALALALCVTLSLGACTVVDSETPSPSTNEQTPAAPSDTQSPAAPETSALSPEQQWAEDNGLNKTETRDELYEAAKKEGKVVVYSISSRMSKVEKSWAEDYPDVMLETYDISTNELLEKITREYEAGIRTCDVVHMKEQTGALYKDYLEPGIFHKYNPEDIFANVDPAVLERYTPLYYELSWWFYNSAANSERPINSWWDLTKPEWKGRFIFTDPMGNQGYMALLTAFVDNADIMAEEYKKVFGEDIVLSDGCENAGYEFIKRFSANDPVFESSSGKIVESVGTATGTTPPVGYAASSKIRERDEQGWPMEAIMDLAPTTGIYGLNTLNIVNEAPHPNGAKLLIRYLVGEADGQGKGFVPFNTIGGWSLRPEVPLAEGNPPLSDIPVFENDFDFVYDNIQTVSDFWLSLQ